MIGLFEIYVSLPNNIFYLWVIGYKMFIKAFWYCQNMAFIWLLILYVPNYILKVILNKNHLLV